MHRLLLGLPIALATAVSPSQAETNLLAGLDANGDGVVSRAEFDAARLHDFRLLDRNGNKVISRREFYWRSRPEDRELLALRKRRYRLMDVNDDGGITGAEYLAFGHKVFARMDTNRDRRLAAGEVAAARGVQVASRDVGPNDARTDDPRPTPAKASGPDRDDRDDNAKALGDIPFAAVDTNGDGYVSRAEYRRAVLTLFRRLDRNDNKVISRREYYSRGSVHDKVRLAARKAAYRRADDNDDGGLTIAEFTRMTQGLFARIDRNKEGRVSRAEWIAAFGPPSTTTARAPQKDDTADKQTAQVRMAMVRTARDGDTDKAARTAPAPGEVTAKPKAEAKTAAKPATREAKPDPESALLANMKRSKVEKKAADADRRAPQVAARPPADETPKADGKDQIDPRLVYAFRSLDRDRDGKISELELAFARMARFAALDANRDQILQPSEFVANRGAAAAARFREMDRDGNGLVTWEEYKAAGNQRFQQLDANSDKRLSLEEFVNAGRVDTSKVRYIKRVKVEPSREAKRVVTQKRSKRPFEYEVPSR